MFFAGFCETLHAQCISQDAAFAMVIETQAASAVAVAIAVALADWK